MLLATKFIIRFKVRRSLVFALSKLSTYFLMVLSSSFLRKRFFLISSWMRSALLYISLWYSSN